MKIHCWTKTPYAHLNPMEWVDATKPAVGEAERVSPALKAKQPGDRVLAIIPSLVTAFDLSDPVKFYGHGPFIAGDIAWSRAFFGRLEQLGVGVDRLVFDLEKGATLFHVQTALKIGRAEIPAIIAKLYADPACQGRLPESVTQYTPEQYLAADWVTAYNAFNAWTHESYYLRAFREGYVEPAREAIGPHIRASDFGASLVMPGFLEAGDAWPVISGSVAGTSSPVMYLNSHAALKTLDARRDYRLSLLKSAIDAAKKAGEDVLPWIGGVSYDVAAPGGSNGEGRYVLDPMYGVDYVRRMIALGVKEFLYWNPPQPYRDEKTILRDDAMMAVIAQGKTKDGYGAVP